MYDDDEFAPTLKEPVSSWKGVKLSSFAEPTEDRRLPPSLKLWRDESAAAWLWRTRKAEG
jgi:hypothetical protein